MNKRIRKTILILPNEPQPSSALPRPLRSRPRPLMDFPTRTTDDARLVQRTHSLRRPPGTTTCDNELNDKCEYLLNGAQHHFPAGKISGKVYLLPPTKGTTPTRTTAGEVELKLKHQSVSFRRDPCATTFLAAANGGGFAMQRCWNDRTTERTKNRRTLRRAPAKLILSQ